MNRSSKKICCKTTKKDKNVLENQITKNLILQKENILKNNV